MKGTRSRVRNALATVLAIVGIGLVALGPPAAADPDVPFTARLTGTAMFTSATSVDFDGAGTATHLGLVSNDGQTILGPPTAGCPNGLSGFPNIHTETLTAADGDELVVRMINLACPTGPTSFHGTGHWTVVSGTGRFSGVTGAGTADGNADFATSTFEITLSGALSHL